MIGAIQVSHDVGCLLHYCKTASDENIFHSFPFAPEFGLLEQNKSL